MVIRRYSDNRWLVHYSVLAACGCYYIRRVLWFKQETQPSSEQIQTEITNYQNQLNELNHKQ